MRGGVPAGRRWLARGFHFASPSYHAALLPKTVAAREPLRVAALKRLSESQADYYLWKEVPVASLLNGQTLGAGAATQTVDAFGAVSGSQLLATADELAALTEHVSEFVPERSDLRGPVRRAEASLLSADGWAGSLIANQTLDFGKQDGITEIEEAIEANPVEHRLNDELWAAEEAGMLVIPRRVALVPCVSNFSHVRHPRDPKSPAPLSFAALTNTPYVHIGQFLDMCRKTLRLIELGVPVVVLSRSHTSQYPYRWVVALASELAAARVDPRYLTFCSADLDGQQALIKAASAAAKADPALADAPPTPFLFTGARGLAAAIKRDVCDGVIASTQGPNLMIALGLPPGVASAAAMSATIENSGQCTAMRVLVAPAAAANSAAVEAMFEGTPDADSASGYLAAGQFAGLLHPPPTTASGDAPRTPDGYTRHPKIPSVAYRVRPGLPDAPGDAPATDDEPPFDEHWRQVVIDVVAPPPPSAGASGVCTAFGDDFVDSVGAWLVKHQPITLSINGASGDAEHAGSSPPEHYAVAARLFERSALCVYSVGDASVPALTAQARPQDGEVFGELPPLGVMQDVTRFPMVVPSAQAAYFSFYSRKYLAGRAGDDDAWEGFKNGAYGPLGALVNAASTPEVKGYLLELASYLRTAAVGPRRTHAARTNLYGLQRPPLDGRLTALRCGELTTLDELLPFLLPFALTNAAGQLLLSIDPSNDLLLDEIPRIQLAGGGLDDIDLRLHTIKQLAAPDLQASLHRIVHPDRLSAEHPFPLPQQFVSRLMPFGHIKSARSDDAHFLATFEPSHKWLRFDDERA